jgi:hypothetical protein
MDISTVVGFIGSIASIVGIYIAIIQTRNLNALKERKNKGTWMAIGGTSHLISSLDQVAENVHDPFIDSMRSQALNLYRALLMEAAMDEKNFSSKTVKSWLKGGKISEWEVHEALKFVSTENLDVDIKTFFNS